MLGLECEVVDDTLQLWAGPERLLESAELLEQMRKKLEEVQRRAEAAERRLAALGAGPERS